MYIDLSCLFLLGIFFDLFFNDTLKIADHFILCTVRSGTVDLNKLLMV